MIYCLCRQINTAKVDEAAVNGARTPKGVMAYHGTDFNCGKCACSIKERLAAIQTPACQNLVAAE